MQHFKKGLGVGNSLLSDIQFSTVAFAALAQLSVPKTIEAETINQARKRGRTLSKLDGSVSKTSSITIHSAGLHPNFDLS